MERMISGQIEIVASRIIEIEVRGTVLSSEGVLRVQGLHQQLRAQPHFESYTVGPAIQGLAGRLQDRLQSTNRRGGYADLIHVATAIAARTSEFWTTDKKIVRWHTEGVISEVRICLPYLDQDVFDL